MVIIFFVLSGYVLSLKGLRPNPGRVLADAAVKRWFRFAPVICISLITSYALFKFHLYRYDDVYALNGAGMFNHYAHLPQDYKPDFWDFLYQGLAGGIFFGEDSYNPVIWTMQLEFYGSMMVFALALLLPRERRAWLFVSLLLLAVLLFQEGIWFFPFLFGVLGVGLDFSRRTTSKATALILLVAGLYFCGYYRPEHWYGWLSFLTLPELTARIFLTTIGGFMLLAVFATHNPISERFSGRVSRVLGKMSFSLYLLHTLFLASFSTIAYVTAGGKLAGIIAAAIAFLLAAAIPVFLLTSFDQWWLRVLARIRIFVRET